jgi:serine/threonine protein kinase/ABC-type glycerol-3-phosphate transport system substrate-binding protein
MKLVGPMLASSGYRVSLGKKWDERRSSLVLSIGFLLCICILCGRHHGSTLVDAYQLGVDMKHIGAIDNESLSGALTGVEGTMTLSSPPFSLRLCLLSSDPLYYNSSWVTQLEAYLREKEALNVTIEVHGQGKLSSEYHRKLPELLESNFADIYQIDVVWSEEMASSFINHSSLLSEYGSSDFYPVFRDSFLVNSSSDGNGGLYTAIPWQMDMGVLYYNESYFDRSSAPRPPYNTYSDLEQAAYQLRSDHVTTSLLHSSKGSSLFPWIFPGEAEESLTAMVLEWIHSLGGQDIIDNETQVHANANVVFDSFSMAHRWVDNITSSDFVELNSVSIMEPFKRGDMALMRNWIGLYRELNLQNANTPLKLTTLPTAGILGGWGLSIAKSSKHLAAAQVVLKTLSSGEYMKLRALEGFIPARISVYDQLCSTDGSWFACFIQPNFLNYSNHLIMRPRFLDTSNGLIMRPSIYAKQKYVNVSTYIYTSANNFFREVYDPTHLRSRLNLMQSELTSIIYLARIDETCGDSNGVHISCLNPLSCVEDVCAIVSAHDGEFCGGLNGYEIPCSTHLECIKNICKVPRGELPSWFPIVLAVCLLGCLLILLTILFVLDRMRVIHVSAWFRKIRKIRDTEKAMKSMMKSNQWQTYHIQYNDLKNMRPIGQGRFGVIYRAKYRDTLVAVKKLSHMKHQPDFLEKFESETRILCGLRHPNIVLFMGACFSPPNFAIVTEFMERGSLYAVLHDPNIELLTHLRLNMFLNICRGMAYLHHFKPQILHRDLKSPNILVDKDFRLKISDFGLTTFMDSSKEEMEKTLGTGSFRHHHRQQYQGLNDVPEIIGTPCWTAPEVLLSSDGSAFSEKSDVYSFGIVMWEIWTRRNPFAQMNPVSVVFNIITHNIRPEIPSWTPKVIANQMSAAWDVDPEKRPDFSQLCETFEKLIETIPMDFTFKEHLLSPSAGILGWRTSWHNFGTLSSSFPLNTCIPARSFENLDGGQTPLLPLERFSISCSTTLQDTSTSLNELSSADTTSIPVAQNLDSLDVSHFQTQKLPNFLVGETENYISSKVWPSN